MEETKNLAPGSVKSYEDLAKAVGMYKILLVSKNTVTGWIDLDSMASFGYGISFKICQQKLANRRNDVFVSPVENGGSFQRNLGCLPEGIMIFDVKPGYRNYGF